MLQVLYFEVRYQHWNFSGLFSIRLQNREVELLSKRSQPHTLPAVTILRPNIRHIPCKPLSVRISLLGTFTFLYHILDLHVSSIPIFFPTRISHFHIFLLICLAPLVLVLNILSHFQDAFCFLFSARFRFLL